MSESPSPSTSSLRFLTLEQFAEELNIGRNQAYSLVRDGSVVAVKIGARGQWRIERTQFEAYIGRLYAEAEGRDPGDLPEEPAPEDSRSND